MPNIQLTNVFSNSQNNKNLLSNSYEVLSGDNIVAVYENNIIRIVNSNLAPAYLLNFMDFEGWLQSRAIDSHRPNSRLLKKALRLKEYDDINTVLNAYAQTITDNYWVRPSHSELAYTTIRFNTDELSDLALNGDYISFNNAALKNLKSPYTPELTNIGSFEKCWKSRNGKWFLYKRATPLQQFSEVFVYHFGKTLGFNMATYYAEKSYTISEDFTNNAELNFEPAHSYLLDNEDYLSNIDFLLTLNNSEHLISDYIKMIYLDTLIANPDRHTFNYGFLRNPQTGAIISLAPNFDNNMALISNGTSLNSGSQPDILIQMFIEVLDKFPMYKKYLPRLSKVLLFKLINNFELENNLKELVVNFIYNRYNQIFQQGR